MTLLILNSTEAKQLKFLGRHSKLLISKLINAWKEVPPFSLISVVVAKNLSSYTKCFTV